MTVERKNTEIFDQSHQMWAEGTSSVKPKVEDIQALLKAENWDIYNVDVSFDDIQGIYRWECNIIRS